MKKIFNTSVWLVLMLVSLNCLAQENSFVRVFDEKGIKIAKGELISVHDSSLTLRNKKETEIPYARIGTIKLKHSFGHATLEGSLFGAQFLVGAIFGGAAGLVADAVTNRPVFIVNQNMENWQKARERLRAFTTEREKSTAVICE